MTEDNQDVFSDDATELSTENSQEDAVSAEQEAKAPVKAREGAEVSEQQGENDAEPPSADENDQVSKEKMIPESRLKAAIKDVNDKLSAANQKIAELTAKPAPDKEKDPDGFALHEKTERSVRLANRVYSDYQEKIDHFNTMAQENALLWKIIGEDDAPAIMAYDLAKQDMELQEIRGLRQSDDWKQFQEWKKSQAQKTADEPVAELLKPQQAQGKPRAIDLASKVPNLNKNPTALTAKQVSRASVEDDDDELFKGHYSHKR